MTEVPAPLDPRVLARFLRGEGESSEFVTVAHALETTSELARSLEQLDTENPWLKWVRDCRYAPGPDGLAESILNRLAPTTLGDAGRDRRMLSAAPHPRHLGEYRLLGVLGAGGMGVVYEAEDERLLRRVAVKVIRPNRIADDLARRRFLQESRTLASVESEYVVPVLGAGEDGNVLFMVMPLLRGRSLADVLADGVPLPPAEAARIGKEAARGLHAAHSRGIVHRDIKPGNVFLEDRVNGTPRVRLLDFGLARADALGRLTQDSVAAMGTPGYIAPELLRGHAADFRADLFSLGVVLYRAATGVEPFGTSGIIAVATDSPKHPLRINPRLPERFADLILHLLEKSPERRPASAEAVATALEVIERGPIRESSRPTRRRALIASVLAAGGLSAVSYASRAPRDTDSEAATTPTLDEQTRAAIQKLTQAGALVTAWHGEQALRIPPHPIPETGIRSFAIELPPEPTKMPRSELLQLVRRLPHIRGFSDESDALGFSDDDLKAMTDRPYAADLRGLLIPAFSLSSENIALLAKFPRLEVLALGAANSDDAILGELVRTLRGIVDLRLFGMGRTSRVTSDGIARLQQIRLHTLKLPGWQGLASESARAIGKLPMAFLELPDTNLNDTMLAGLSDSRPPYLISLNVVGSLVTEAAAIQFANQHPRCEVRWTGGTIPRTGLVAK
ncbi:MAG: serine/threonine-protein kinase [Gemmataceae bacterium]